MRKFLVIILVLSLSAGELERVKLQIKLLERKIEKLEREEKSLSAELEKLDLKLRLVQEKIKLEKLKLSRLEENIAQLEKQQKELKKKLDLKKKEIEKLLVAMYKIGTDPHTKILADIKDYRSLSFALIYLRFLSNQQARLINEYSRLLDENRRTSENLYKSKEQVKTSLSRLNQLRRQLSKLKRRRKQELNKILREKKKASQLLQQLKEKEKELAGVFKGFQKEKPITGLYGLKRGLPWPVRGRIVRRFGLQVHPVFRTKIFSNGIEIKPYRSYEVRAVAAGRVVYVSDFRGYGKIVIIDHGRRYYTLYGHLLDVKVEKGQFVRQGDVIGYIGEGSFWRGKTLYFEIRYRGKPLNPLKWLRRK